MFSAAFVSQVRRLRAAARRRSGLFPLRLRQPHVLFAVPPRPAQLRAPSAPARHAGLPRLLPLPPRHEARRVGSTGLRAERTYGCGWGGARAAATDVTGAGCRRSRSRTRCRTRCGRRPRRGARAARWSGWPTACWTGSPCSWTTPARALRHATVIPLRA